MRRHILFSIPGGATRFRARGEMSGSEVGSLAVKALREAQSLHVLFAAEQAILQIYADGATATGVSVLGDRTLLVALCDAVAARAAAGRDMLLSFTAKSSKPMKPTEAERQVVEIAVRSIRLMAKTSRAVAQVFIEMHEDLLLACLKLGFSSTAAEHFSGAVGFGQGSEGSLAAGAHLQLALRLAAFGVLSAVLGPSAAANSAQKSPLPTSTTSLERRLASVCCRLALDEADCVAAAAMSIIDEGVALEYEWTVEAAGSIVARWEQLPAPLMAGRAAAGVSKTLRCAASALALPTASHRTISALLCLGSQLLRAVEHLAGYGDSRHVCRALVHLSYTFPAVLGQPAAAALARIIISGGGGGGGGFFVSPLLGCACLRLISAHLPPTALRRVLVTWLCSLEQEQVPAPRLLALWLAELLRLCSAEMNLLPGHSKQGSAATEVCREAFRSAQCVSEVLLVANGGRRWLREILSLIRSKTAVRRDDVNDAAPEGSTSRQAATWLTAGIGIVMAQVTHAGGDGDDDLLLAGMEAALGLDEGPFRSEAAKRAKAALLYCSDEVGVYLGRAAAAVCERTLALWPAGATTRMELLLSTRSRARTIVLTSFELLKSTSDSIVVGGDLSGVSRASIGPGHVAAAAQCLMDDAARLVDGPAQLRDRQSSTQRCRAEISAWLTAAPGLPALVRETIEKTRDEIGVLLSQRLTTAMKHNVEDDPPPGHLASCVSEDFGAHRRDFYSSRCRIARFQSRRTGELGERTVEDTIWLTILRTDCHRLLEPATFVITMRLSCVEEAQLTKDSLATISTVLLAPSSLCQEIALCSWSIAPRSEERAVDDLLFCEVVVRGSVCLASAEPQREFCVACVVCRVLDGPASEKAPSEPLGIVPLVVEDVVVDSC
jgi:hypothetical protein